MSIATSTPTIRLLKSEWQRVQQSIKLHDSLKKWTSSDTSVAALPTQEIIDALTLPSWERQGLRDKALTCLLRHKSDPLSQLTVLQSLLPQIIHLVDLTWRHDPDEQAAEVVSVALGQIVKWNNNHALCVHWWLYQNISREITHSTRRRRILEQRELLQAHAGENDACHNTTNLEDLISMLMQQADLDRFSAETVVLTRTNTLSIATLAKHAGMTPQSLRRRRLRAEKRLRHHICHTDLTS